jgi:UDP-N-acetylmuramate--alanine ligase
MDISSPKKIHFVGVAGVGMSAIAQYLAGNGHIITGSDREFGKGTVQKVQQQLEAKGITCVPQDGTAIDNTVDAIVISTAIENTIPDLAKAMTLNIPVLHRSEMLKIITNSKKTIAFSGTSGKSTTTALAFHILHECGKEASLITGAGLISLQEQGLIGNAYVGTGEWLLIEADESDGTLVNYTPEIGVMLNLDKDHKEMHELFAIFETFKNNTKHVIVHDKYPDIAKYSTHKKNDFGEKEGLGYTYAGFKQLQDRIQFTINNIAFEVPLLGAHNMENIAAAVAAVCETGLVTIADCAKALQNYKGIYRRLQILGVKKNVLVIDDYAHNPVKIAAAIRTFQSLTQRVIAWFQPHGYGPTRFLRADFVHEITHALRPADQIWMSEIFYAGGTAVKDISANDLIQDIKATHSNAFFVEHRNDLVTALKQQLQAGDILLLMGARDPSLEKFTNEVFNAL